MRRILKGLLIALIGLIGLVTIVLLVVPFVYDTDDLKAAATRAVKESTGRNLAINGDLRLSVFPVLSLDARDVVLGQAPDFNGGGTASGRPFAALAEARLGVALLPLLRGEVIVEDIELSGLNLDLQVNSAGLSNWQDLSDLSTGTESPAGADAPPQAPDLEIGALALSDAVVRLQDEAANLDYRLSNLQLTTGELGQLLKGNLMPLAFSSSVEDLKSDQSGRIELAGELRTTTDFKRFEIADLEGALSTTGFENLALAAPLLSLNLAEETLQLNTYSGALGVAQFDGALHMSEILGDVTFSGHLNLPEFSPRDLFQDLDMAAPVTSDPAVLGSLRGSAQFAGDLSGVMIEALELELDNSILAGTAVTTFGGTTDFALNVDELNLDRYLPPAPQDAAAADPQAGGDEVLIPVTALRELNLSGTLSVQRLTVFGTLLQDARVTLSAGDGQLRLYPFTAGLLGGQYEGDIRIDSRGDIPVIQFNEKLQAIPFKALAGDFFDYEQLSGLAAGTIRGSTRGSTLDALLEGLGGDLALQLEDGALEGVDLWYEIRSAVALLKDEPAPTQNAGRTVFSNLQWAADIENGLLQTRTMTGTLPFLQLKGAGNIDFRDMTMDLRIRTTVRDVPEVSTDPLAADLGGREIPLVISGPLLDPAVQVDMASVLKGALTDQLLDRLSDDDDEDEDGDGEKDDVKDAARSLLEGLLDPDGMQ